MSRRRPTATPEQSFVEGFFSTLWALISLPFKNKTKGLSDAEARELASHWEAVTDMAAVPATQAMAISEADKLLDATMRALNLPGTKMSERLRAAEPRLGRDLSNEVWRAHKLRNQIAHEVGHRVSEREVNQALNAFARALRILGVPV
jgi:hypothetical protein